MKRKVYRIKSTVGHDITKYAWNSALKAVDHAMQGMANGTGIAYFVLRAESESIKEGFYYVKGTRVWFNPTNSARIVFTITKEQ